MMISMSLLENRRKIFSSASHLSMIRSLSLRYSSTFLPSPSHLIRARPPTDSPNIPAPWVNFAQSRDGGSSYFSRPRVGRHSRHCRHVRPPPPPVTPCRLPRPGAVTAERGVSRSHRRHRRRRGRRSRPSAVSLQPCLRRRGQMAWGAAVPPCRGQQ